ncbi:MAG: hypothetical protein R3F59_07955 [Myxococcota bacterium]
MRVTPAQGVTVRYAVDGRAERTAASDPATEHDLELDVLRPEETYRFVVRADDRTERSGSFGSGTPPAEVASRLEVTGTPSFPYLGTSAPSGRLGRRRRGHERPRLVRALDRDGRLVGCTC